MALISGEEVMLGQENGPEVRLIAFGDEFYARYESPEGYPAIYDEDVGLFCYARVEDGCYVSTGVPVMESPPTDVVKHAQESPEVRQKKAASKQAARMAPEERELP